MYQERGLGIPKSDVQRVARHYNISESEAEEWLTIHPVEMLLSARGAGLTTGRAAGSIGNEEPENLSCWPFMVVGLVTGAILGVGFAMILQKGEAI